MDKKINKRHRVVIAMSGGVDSSVAAYLLKKQGYDVIGIFLKFWQPPEDSCGVKKENSCCNLESLSMARQIAEIIDIPFYVIHVEDQFKKDIVDYFIKEYEGGRTPNPCVSCNKAIKFGFLWKKAKELGADYLATGHYIKTKRRKKDISDKQKNIQYPISNISIYRPKDKIKDQTYFLSHITKNILPHLLFPLADLEKKEVRAIAKKAKLPVFSKKDSQGVCFIPDGDNSRFLLQNSKKLNKPGDIVDKEGNKLGKHKGLVFYTVGQKIGSDLAAAQYMKRKYPISNIQYPTNTQSSIPKEIQRLYVISINVKKNQLIIGEDKDCFSDLLVAQNLHVLNDGIFRLAKENKDIYAQIRGGHKAEKCTIKIKNDDTRIK